MTAFWIQEAVTMAILSAAAFFLGLSVLRYGFRVNYTRKVLRVVLLVVPLVLFDYLPYTPTGTTCCLKGCILVVMFLVLSKPFRDRFAPCRICFAALDRPEDRPYTMLLLTSQAAACFSVIILTAMWLELYDAERLILIGLLVDGLGDALAEPVGIAFGRHRYQTRSLFSQERHVRTLEGSACVFLSAMLGIFFVRDAFSTVELLIAVATIPVIVTLVEAYSPHTWDGPFLYFASAAGSVGVFEVGNLIDRVGL